MSSRYNAARPNRDGELYARTHHHDGESDPKRVKFDVRNPSTLAPDAPEEDAVLEADVIGKRNSTKRGAVNLDGYDSDSDNDNIKTQGDKKKENAQPPKPDDDDDDDDDDMFAEVDEAEDEDKKESGVQTAGSDKKKVKFLDASEIQGQVDSSTTGGQIRLDDKGSSDDEEDVELAIQEEGVDEEVGAGGLKRNAPKVEAFNLKQEMEDGQFDESGNYIRKAGDPDAVHDNWLEGLSKKDMKKAAEAHERREAAARKQRIEEDSITVPDLLKTLILRLDKAETPLEALARLGKGQTKVKKTPKWKLKKMKKESEDMEVDQEAKEDPEQARIRESINAITEAADHLLTRGFEEIYDQEREMLVRDYRRETGEDWVESAKPAPDDDDKPVEQRPAEGGKMWEFRWSDGRDGGATQGPFDGVTMKAWKDAGYFEGGVEFRWTDKAGEWSTVPDFA
ncbi:hypothetical protein B0I35DRAFT_408153 [Stachybotrys elegans]|uniref:GYF domain-containing protein n=1 Tax=Stachybotrys elegans TaxID=80388 RepID=A0A8K0SYK7_9HYPO|nr:hypothetical protein B0I35DRAFT_408153 [Stachybotrys elegans]